MSAAWGTTTFSSGLSKAGDPRSNLDPTDRLDAADEVNRPCDRLTFRFHYADRNRRRLLLGTGRVTKNKAQESSTKCLAHFGPMVSWSAGDFREHPVRRCP
jgi:hypothetical protein